MLASLGCCEYTCWELRTAASVRVQRCLEPELPGAPKKMEGRKGGVHTAGQGNIAQSSAKE